MLHLTVPRGANNFSTRLHNVLPFYLDDWWHGINIRVNNVSNKKLSWYWQRARRVCRSVEVNKHFGSIPSKI